MAAKRKYPEPVKPYGVRLPPSLWTRLAKIAKRDQRSCNNLIVLALQTFVETMEEGRA